MLKLYPTFIGLFAGLSTPIVILAITLNNDRSILISKNLTGLNKREKELNDLKKNLNYLNWRTDFIDRYQNEKLTISTNDNNTVNNNINSSSTAATASTSTTNHDLVKPNNDTVKVTGIHYNNKDKNGKNYGVYNWRSIAKRILGSDDEKHRKFKTIDEFLVFY
ncbi:unnamed protein product [[Candida] boidinii]|uniref:Unnamed protein product n=1 Tax=Candida boidinii TaxID=5477 RepID=A0A9W6WM81_CANBO|nr:hypothetical protein B5S30_g4346 [[Candida] boidinii]OWB86789.1 hypothetical protein B5S33_g5503 [[Candida] boidinii]GME81288.1 unnamed protein product [[Candida] boidinii]GMG25238.1 unnamed protein product [[Candida] boidinii]